MSSELADTPENMLDIALTYLADEWSVFPVCSPVPTHRGYCEQHGACRNPGKLPLVKWGMYQDRCPTKLEVQTWWRKWPKANIGLATGVTSDIVVVDLDGELAVAAADRYGFDPGPWVRTGRVGGRHLYFRYRPDAPTIFAKVGGIDFRGQGGFVLLPPSLHYSGAHYTWGEQVRHGEPLPDLPAWVDDLASTNERGQERGPIDFGKLLSEGVSEGQRDQELFRAAAKLRGADVPYELALQLIQGAAAQCKPPFDQAEAKAKVDSAYSRYQPNAPAPMQLFGQGTAAVDPSQAAITVATNDYRLIPILDVMSGEERAVVQLVEGLMWKRRVHWIFADAGTGKTLWALALHMHIAAGRPFLGRQVIQGPVAIIEEDSPLDTVIEYAEVLADIYNINLAEIPFYMNHLTGLRLTDEAGIQKARAAIDSCPQKPVAVILDAAERLVPSEKFTSRELDPFDRFLKGLVNQQDIVPTVIDHINRSGRGDKSKVPSQVPKPLELLYGGQSKHAISDVMLFLNGKLRDGPVEASWQKFRVSGSEPPGFSLTFNEDRGFALKEHRMSPSTESQIQVHRFLEMYQTWHSKTDLLAATQIADKRLQRALNALVAQRWAEVAGETTDRRWRLRQDGSGVFS